MPIRSIVDVPAPAKLNLWLHVTGRRADGYHLLESRMVPIDWFDTLHFERRDDAAVARRDLGTPLPQDDLCLRAARALQAAAATPLGADIAIEKRIPPGAGLGGGSSDAATVLLALNRLWSLDWPLSRLMPIGAALGADVPFFLGGTPAIARGIGERLEAVDEAPATYAVVKPAASLATRDVFSSPRVAELLATRPADGGAAARIAGFPAKDDPHGSAPAGRNDLEAAARDLCPEVTQAIALLRDRYGASRMTGSGSAVWARIPDEGAEPALPALPPGWQGRICRSLAAHPLSSWARRD